MKRAVLIISSSVSLSMAWSEPSIYQDVINDPSAVIKRNAKEIKVLKRGVENLNERLNLLTAKFSKITGKIDKLEEKIDGIYSVFDGHDDEIKSVKRDLNKFQKLEDKIDNIYQKIEIFEETLKELNQKISNLKSKKFNPDRYVNNQPAPYESSIDKEEELFKQAVLYFNKRKYKKAKDIFKKLIDKEYKLASVNFYLGEIAFREKRYNDAIIYYKNSYYINRNSEFKDKLLLNTGIAFLKQNQYDRAKRFFDIIIKSSDNNNIIKRAKKFIDKIESFKKDK